MRKLRVRAMSWEGHLTGGAFPDGRREYVNVHITYQSPAKRLVSGDVAGTIDHDAGGRH
ncbi:MAG: hypothetical protein R2839_06985 [Thermomicrobiales bacterium]